MKRRLLIVAAAVAVAAVVAAVSTSAFSGSTPPPGCCTFTASDSGRLFKIQAGQVVRVRLTGSPHAPWTEPHSTSTAVVRRRVTRSGDLVAGVFVAEHRGRADLRALQEPLCRKATPPCAAPTRLFVVHLVVR
jgi:hypothetical protein